MITTSIKPADLIDSRGIAELLGVSRAHVTDRLSKRTDFPRPAINVSQRVRKWRSMDVLRWAGAAVK